MNGAFQEAEALRCDVEVQEEAGASPHVKIFKILYKENAALPKLK
jgi:hypothetical protein